MKALALAAALLLSTGAPAEAAQWSAKPIRLTWYGSDYFGKRTACGQRYSRHIVGVATWLPLRCGTKIALRWKGRTVIAPVIDRMPRRTDSIKFDASAHIACELLNGPRQQGKCFTRSNVYWRVVR